MTDLLLAGGDPLLPLLIDYRVAHAASGAAALRCVLQHDFAVILVDVALPDLTGFEVAALIEPRVHATPIILLTPTSPDVGFIRRAAAVGVVEYLIAPFDAAVVHTKLTRLIALGHDADSPARAVDRQRKRIVTEINLAIERRYRRLAEALPQIVWTTDAAGALTYVNRRWADYTGLPTGDAFADFFAVVHSEDAPHFGQLWRVALAERTPLELECRLRRFDGALRWHLCRAVPERDDAAHVIGWLGTCTDVDDRRRALDAAQASLHARDEFLSIASHELRTPLTTLNLRLESLTEDGRASGDAKLRSRLESARRQSERLGSLVDNMLDVARITSGRLVLAREPFDLRDVAGELIDRFAELAAVAGCTLELSAVPATGSWDRIRIDQVLQNLLSNAIKYAPRTTIEIAITADATTARVAIRDRGPGIAAADTERIFAQFERAVSTRHHGGLGMGLYIARQIALAHGGALQIDSAPGQGATFTVVLPR